MKQISIALALIACVCSCGNGDGSPEDTSGSATDGTVCERDCDHNPRPECATDGTREQCVAGCESLFANHLTCTAEQEAFVFCKLSQPSSGFQCDPVDGTTVLVDGVCAAQLEAVVACW